MPKKRGNSGDELAAAVMEEPGVELAGGEQQGIRTALIQRSTFGIRAVQYAVIDGMAVFEGDIILGEANTVASQTESLRAVASGAVAAAVVITGDQHRWPNCTIPYDIDAGLPNQSRVADAINHWQTHTSYKFVLRAAAVANQYPDWVTFQPSTGCSSSVGRQGGQQAVNLGPSCTAGNAIHEIGHVVGLWHEQSREDRDSFVTIHWDKIQSGYEHNFDQHINDGDDVGAYDYGSIMHYPRNAFSIDASDTITPVQAGAQIGQRTALSSGDIAAANSLCLGAGPTRKEMVRDRKDPTTDLGLTTKEMVRDRKAPTIDAGITLKERIKDVRLDTTKERITDTLKESIRDPLKRGPFDGGGTLAENVVNPSQRVLPARLGALRRRSLGALPLALALAHQAPGAADTTVGDADAAAILDEQLQSLAEAISDTDATRQALQEEYDATASLLAQTIDAIDQEGN